MGYAITSVQKVEPSLQVIFQLAPRFRGLSGLDTGTQLLEIAQANGHGVGRVDLCDPLPHRLLRGVAPHSLHGGTDVGNGAIQAHGPDYVVGIVGQESVPFLAEAQFCLRLPPLADVLLQPFLRQPQVVFQPLGVHDDLAEGNEQHGQHQEQEPQVRVEGHGQRVRQGRGEGPGMASTGQVGRQRHGQGGDDQGLGVHGALGATVCFHDRSDSAAVILAERRGARGVIRPLHPGP